MAPDSTKRLPAHTQGTGCIRSRLSVFESDSDAVRARTCFAIFALAPPLLMERKVGAEKLRVAFGRFSTVRHVKAIAKASTGSMGLVQRR